MYLQFVVVGILSSLAYAEVTEKEYDLMPELFRFDDFDKCLFNNDDNVYCVTTIQLRPEDERNASQVWKIIEEVSTQPQNYRHDRLRHGICCPQQIFSKHNQSVHFIYEDMLKGKGLKSEVVELRCETNRSRYAWTNTDAIIWIVMGLYFGVVLLISSVLAALKISLSEKYEKFSKTKVGRALLVFSVGENWRLLTKTEPKMSIKHFIPGIQGMRAISAVYVIMLHTALGNSSIPSRNPRYMERASTKLVAASVGCGNILIQIYFVLSGWTLVLSLIKTLEKSGRITLGYIVRYIIARYVRLVPVLAVLVAFHSTMFVHLSRGSFWDMVVGEEYRRCRSDWWSTLFFMNNFASTDGICLAHTWYLSTDFQLFVLFATIFWLVQKKLGALYYISALASVAQIFALFLVLFWNHWEIAIHILAELGYKFEFVTYSKFVVLWISPYFSVSGYAIGALFGYIYWKNQNKKLFTKSYQVGLVWTICLFLVFGHTVLYMYYLSSSTYTYIEWFSPIYGSISKTLFASGIALMLFVMSHKTGGFFSKILESRFCHLLAQLSYGAYIVHFSVIFFSIGTKKMPPYLSDSSTFADGIINVTVSFFLSLCLTLTVQIPFAILSKALTGRNK